MPIEAIPAIAINTMSHERRKESQRDRLLSAMTEIAGHEGYVTASISRVIAAAGVSRPTFYDYFVDKDDCFRAAVAQGQTQLLAQARAAVGAAPPAQALQTVVAAAIGFAAASPAVAQLLMHETVVAERAAPGARAAGIAELVAVIERAYGALPPSAPVPDLSPRIAIAAVYRLLSMRLRNDDREITEMLEPLLAWLVSYERPIGERRFSALTPVELPPSSPGVPLDPPLYAPAPLAPGRQRLSAEDIAHNHRERLIYAVSRVIVDKGMLAMTVTDIIDVAGLDRRAFYRVFADKQEAFGALHEIYFQRVLAVSGGAYFRADTWPERVWEAGLAFAALMDHDPNLARVSFVEARSGDQAALQRYDDAVTTFVLFLQEGFQHSPSPDIPPRLALDAIASANFEISYDQILASETPHLLRLLPHVTYLCLAPFIGSEAATRLVDRLIAAARA